MEYFKSKLTGGIQILYEVSNHVVSKKSKYQTIDIIDNPNFGKMLFINQDLQIASKDAKLYNDSLLYSIYNSIPNSEILVLGGGSGSCVNEIKKRNPKKIIVVGIDKDVVNLSAKFLSDLNENVFEKDGVECIFKDALKFLKEYKRKFDIIVLSLTDISKICGISQPDFYLMELIKECNLHLKNKGLIAMQCCSALDNYSIKLLKGRLSKEFIQSKFLKVKIPSYKENWIFYSGLKICHQK